MSKIGERLFADYAAAHTTRGNRACHTIGIPLIVFSTVLALTRIPLEGRWSAAELVIVAAVLAAFFLDAAAAALFLSFLVLCDLAARAISSGTAAAFPGLAIALAGFLFVVGWIFQLVGHSVYEKNRPAFLRNLRHLLVGPLWIARKVL